MFLELGALLPRVHLHLVFVGPDVPIALDGRSALFGAPPVAACGVAGCSCSSAGQGRPTRHLSLVHHRRLLKPLIPVFLMCTGRLCTPCLCPDISWVPEGAAFGILTERNAVS